METFKLRDLSLDKFLKLDCAAIRIASPGAQGDPDSVCVVTTDSKIYYGRGEDDLLALNNDVWKDCSFLCFRWRKKIPSNTSTDALRGFSDPVSYFANIVEDKTRWNVEYLGGGNSLFLNESIANDFYKELERQCIINETSRENVFLYSVWLSIITNVLQEKH